MRISESWRIFIRESYLFILSIITIIIGMIIFFLVYIFIPTKIFLSWWFPIGFFGGALIVLLKEGYNLSVRANRDINLRLDLEEAKKFEYLSVMASATAHQLNQPIGIIRAATDAAIDDLAEGFIKSPEDIKPTLHRILEQSTRMATIINKFRDFARGDRNKHDLVHLNQVIEHGGTFFENQLRQHHIALHLEMNTQIEPTVWGNRFQLEEVLINLLSNAKDVLADQTEAVVWVKTWATPTECGFSVEDNGPGLAKAYRQDLFFPFASTKPTESGTGLGLYLARRIVREFNGDLIYTDRPAGGAKFTVILPRATAQKTEE